MKNETSNGRFFVRKFVPKDRPAKDTDPKYTVSVYINGEWISGGAFLHTDFKSGEQVKDSNGNTQLRGLLEPRSTQVDEATGDAGGSW